MIVMDVNYKKKLFASTITVALVFSSLIFLTGAQAGPADDLVVSNLYGPAGSPPPRANVPYDMVVGWKNTGDTETYSATVRLFSNCDQSGGPDSESDPIEMTPDSSGTVNLSVTFTDEGENTCYSATIHYGSADYGEFETSISVEPEIGNALLWIDLSCENDDGDSTCMESHQAAQGEEFNVIFEFGNNGNVSTQNRVTFMAYFDEFDDETLDSDDSIAPSPFTFDFISPPPNDPGWQQERMQWEYTIPPNIEDGRYKFTAIIDSEENNTEDLDLEDNVAVWEMCIGDCSEPDLKIWENGLDSIRAEPIDPIAGTDITFKYSVENIGEGNANPPQGPGTGDFVMHLKVMKCPATEEEPGGDCTGQTWVYVNESKAVKTPIEGNGDVFTSDEVLGLTWSSTPNDAGIWNVQVIADAEEVIGETDETNNDLDWYKVYGEYFELREQRPDLVVSGIDQGIGRVYQDDPRTIQVSVSQTELGDAMADKVDVFIKIRDPDFMEFDWFKMDNNKTVGLSPEITFFEYTWVPSKLGVYEFYAWVDKEDAILEWVETNNEYDSEKSIEVFEKLPDLQVVSVSVAPLNDDGFGMVGISSNITATVANLGVRNMTSSEGSKLEVTFYTAAPFSAELATINVNQALSMGETVDISVPFLFSENAQYRFIAKVDEDRLIAEEDDWNNEDYKNIYAVSAMDAYVSNLSVVVNDGLAGKDHPLTFDLGMSNLPTEGTYRLHFNVSIDGTFGWGEVLTVSMENITVSGNPAGSCDGKNVTVNDDKQYCAVGTGYQVSGFYGFIDFDSTYNHQTVVMPWIPNAQRTDDYVILVEVSSDINVILDNDAVNTSISIEKLTTNLLVESIKVTESGGSATVKVTVGYPQGEQSQLDTDVTLKVYRASDYAAGSPPIDELTAKTVTGLLKGDSRPISFTWAVKNGDFIFVAVVDPDNQVKEINELDNSFPSLEVTFGDTTTVGPSEEEDEGLFGLPAPTFIVAMGIIGLVALTRRRS